MDPFILLRAENEFQVPGTIRLFLRGVGNLVSVKWHFIISMFQMELNRSGHLNYWTSNIPANSKCLYFHDFSLILSIHLYWVPTLCQPGNVNSTKDTHMKNLLFLCFYTNTTVLHHQLSPISPQYLNIYCELYYLLIHCVMLFKFLENTIYRDAHTYIPTHV